MSDLVGNPEDQFSRVAAHKNNRLTWKNIFENSEECISKSNLVSVHFICLPVVLKIIPYTFCNLQKTRYESRHDKTNVVLDHV